MSESEFEKLKDKDDGMPDNFELQKESLGLVSVFPWFSCMHAYISCCSGCVSETIPARTFNHCRRGREE